MPTKYYPDEGNLIGYRCPKCGSKEIICTNAVYEFTSLECKGCGHKCTVDDWQITEWFANGDDGL